MDAVAKRVLLAVALICVGVGVLAGALLVTPTARPEPPASPAALAQADDPAACRLRVRSAMLSPHPETVRAWKRAGVRIGPISPAVAVGGAAVAMQVTGFSGVRCDATGGVVGLRGGLRFARGDRRAELRRARLDLSAHVMTAPVDATGAVGAAAPVLRIGRPQHIEHGEEVTIVLPLRVTPDLWGTIDVALGEEIFSADATVGSLTLVGEVIRATP
jgi:hypothetical protein